MKKNTRELIQELISFENKVSELYGLFMENFAEDSQFWEKIKNEEENHAMILDNAQKQFLRTDEFPPELIALTLLQAIAENKKLDNILNRFKQALPARIVAFNTALEIEGYLPEYIYQKAMEKLNHHSAILGVIQKINKDEKDHFRRIKAHMEVFNLHV
ncbi:MAG: hypothetical protein V1747_09890 [Candidatus Omnitrophota bacterium]